MIIAIPLRKALLTHLDNNKVDKIKKELDLFRDNLDIVVASKMSTAAKLKAANKNKKLTPNQRQVLSTHAIEAAKVTTETFLGKPIDFGNIDLQCFVAESVLKNKLNYIQSGIEIMKHWNEEHGKGDKYGDDEDDES